MNPTYILWFVLLAGIFWVMIVRPQRNAKRRAAELSQSLQTGDEVVTIGGLYGRVVSIDDSEVELEAAEGVVLRFARRAIAGKAPAELLDEDDDVEDDDLEDDGLEDDDDFEDDDEIDDDVEDDDETAPKADESIGR
jgi:preprotein translocase subunit YajC